MGTPLPLDPISAHATTSLTKTGFIKDPALDVYVPQMPPQAAQVEGAQNFQTTLAQCAEKLHAVQQQTPVAAASEASTPLEAMHNIRGEMEQVKQVFSTMKEISSALETAYQELMKLSQ